MDALGKPTKEPIRSTLPKKQSPKYLMPLLTVGIMIVLGSSVLWVTSGTLECTKEQKTIEPQLCSNITWMDQHMSIGLIIGFALIILGIISSLGSNEQQNPNEVDKQ